MRCTKSSMQWRHPDRMQFLYRFEAMTTPCEVAIYTAEKGRADSVAQEILKEAKRLEKKYSFYRSDSYLSRLNRREEERLDPETKNLLQRAKRYYTLTEGVFDVTVATLKHLYREDTGKRALEEAQKALMPYVGCEHLEIRRDRLRFDNPHTRIDLGGFVKEYAVDRAAKLLKKRGIVSALVNFGGDIHAVGRRPDGGRFRVGIKDPKQPANYATFVEIENEALTTSASYERNITIEGERYSHILSKVPHANPPASVTVISPECIESGVYSTALMIDPTLKVRHKVIHAVSNPSAYARGSHISQEDVGYGLVDYRDYRYSGALSLTQRIANRDEITYGISYNNEYDFHIPELSLGYKHWLDGTKNSAIEASVAYQKAWVLIWCRNNTLCDTNSGASETFYQYNTFAQLAYSRILDRDSQMEVTLFYNNERGFLSNPYKNIVRNYATDPIVTNERRPDLREGYSVKLAYQRALRRDLTWHGSYRFAKIWCNPFTSTTTDRITGCMLSP